MKHLFEYPQAPDTPPALTLPEPPRSLRWQRWLVAIGIFILGVSSPITGTVAYNALNNSEKSQALTEESIDLARENLAVTGCRAELASAVTAAEGEIDSLLASGMLDAVRGASDEHLAVVAEQMDKNIAALAEAQRRRDAVDEICGEPPEIEHRGD